ncbi:MULTISPECIES: hypothetical protein [Haloferax]|uniref:Uncharacterized protein n=1 Tax=Haloferax massiliensis TaxID=1476858 RepID=A0A0D6JRX5_9EURY|nr:MULTISPECIES: hypothetical protein [Haloferax]MDS0240545.1 hypothetical protein [Haloferax sp. S2CR25]MDS0443666.1 hypothetical protein [Haloferax sp. S2CR25-2]CQR50666.1 hypothetical protein BN996_02149 [Haloferax massiliensis]
MSSPAPDDVGRALSALADADADIDDRPGARPPAEVVADARDAFQSLSSAARFLSDGGELTLRRAVGEAARRGNHDCARSGRALLADLDRLHVALADAADGSNRDSRAAEGRPRDPDHFRSGRTTVFSGGVEPSDR